MGSASKSFKAMRKRWILAGSDLSRRDLPARATVSYQFARQMVGQSERTCWASKASLAVLLRANKKKRYFRFVTFLKTTEEPAQLIPADDL